MLCLFLRIRVIYIYIFVYFNKIMLASTARANAKLTTNNVSVPHQI